MKKPRDAGASRALWAAGEVTGDLVGGRGETLTDLVLEIEA